MLGHKGGRLADGLGNLTLLRAFRQLAPDVVGNLAGSQVVALEVLDNLVGLVVVVVDETRNVGLAGQLRPTKAARAMVDEIPARHVWVLAHGNRRFDPTKADRLREFAQAFRGEPGAVLVAGLIRIFIDKTDGQQHGASATRRHRRSVQKARQVTDAVQAQA